MPLPEARVDPGGRVRARPARRGRRRRCSTGCRGPPGRRTCRRRSRPGSRACGRGSPRSARPRRAGRTRVQKRPFRRRPLGPGDVVGPGGRGALVGGRRPHADRRERRADVERELERAAAGGAGGHEVVGDAGLREERDLATAARRCRRCTRPGRGRPASRCRPRASCRSRCPRCSPSARRSPARCTRTRPRRRCPQHEGSSGAVVASSVLRLAAKGSPATASAAAKASLAGGTSAGSGCAPAAPGARTSPPRTPATAARPPSGRRRARPPRRAAQRRIERRWSDMASPLVEGHPRVNVRIVAKLGREAQNHLNGSRRVVFQRRRPLAVARVQAARPARGAKGRATGFPRWWAAACPARAPARPPRRGRCRSTGSSTSSGASRRRRRRGTWSRSTSPACARSSARSASPREPSGYRLRLEPEELDTVRFERLCAEGSEALAAGEAERASARLGEALELWRGPALADFAYERFAEVEARRLDELKLHAEEEWVDAELALGRAAGLVARLEEHVARAPLRERRHGQLMLALADGRPPGRRPRRLPVGAAAARDRARPRAERRAAPPGARDPHPGGRLAAAGARRRPRPGKRLTRRVVTVLSAELADGGHGARSRGRPRPRRRARSSPRAGRWRLTAAPSGSSPTGR